jgi:hypothetical protein
MLFKTTKDIFKAWNDELWDENLLNSDKIVYPPRVEWDYSRPLNIEDIDIWEVLCSESGGRGVWAAWMPYAEFYLVRPGWQAEHKNGLETYYGPNARIEVIKRAKELGLSLNIQKIWVDPDDMWKYSNVDTKPSTLILP